MVGVKYENPVHCPRQHRVHYVVFTGHGKAHAQEIGGISKIVLRINEGLSDVILESHGGDRRQFGDHPVRGDFALAGIVDIG